MNFNHPLGTTKGEAAERLYPGETYDCAVPQSWIDACYERGFNNVAQHFITLYPKEKGKFYPNCGSEYIAPVTDRGVEIAARLATYNI